MISNIKTKIKLNCNNGIFHDSRGDVNRLGKVIVECIEKINELTEEVNKMKEKNNE